MPHKKMPHNTQDKLQSHRDSSQRLDTVCQTRVDSAVNDVTRQYQMYCLLLLLALGATLVYCNRK